MNNTVVIKPQFDYVHGLTYGKLVIDCPSHSNIIISGETCEEVPNCVVNYQTCNDVYINVNSMLTCESFMVDSEHLYVINPFSQITFMFNDYEIIMLLQKEFLTFSSVLASMYAVWLAFCGHFEQVWLANVMAQSQRNGKPSIEILTKTLQGLWSSKRFNLEDFDIKRIPYIKDVIKTCTYEFLEDNARLLDKEQIISMIEELNEDQGERKAMLIQAAGLKDDNSRRFEL